MRLDQTAREDLLERFLRYVRLDTRADEHSESSPSTAKQLDLSRLLADECRGLGLEQVEMTEGGIVYATLPANDDGETPTICWFAHVDTSPEYTAENVNPLVHRNYDGKDIALPEGDGLVVRTEENPKLAELIGGTVITTDGSTLLGADDKSGIATIMSATAWLMAHPDVRHGEIRLCFTTDEEIGRGCEGIDLKKIDAVCGYTLDSEGTGRFDVETFSADLCVVTVQGVNTHPSVAKGVMVNAVRALAEFLNRLPKETDSPETTEDREGFMHPYEIEGGVSEASARIILRDFETDQLARYQSLLTDLAQKIEAAYRGSKVELQFRQQYRNMRDGLAAEPRAVDFAEAALRAAGIDPRRGIIRGGTDGSQLTALGLPTPNLSTGQHNPHSPLEWTSLEEMSSCAEVLTHLAEIWSRET